MNCETNAVSRPMLGQPQNISDCGLRVHKSGLIVQPIFI